MNCAKKTSVVIQVHSPVYDTWFNLVSVHEDSSGEPLLICENKDNGFDRMVFRPLEVSCNVPHLWKNKPVKFYKP